MEKTTIPIIVTGAVKTEVRRLIETYQKAIKTRREIFKEFTDKLQLLFDIAKCHCINLCKCHNTDKVPAIFKDFLFDQRGQRLQSLHVPDPPANNNDSGDDGVDDEDDDDDEERGNQPDTYPSPARSEYMPTIAPRRRRLRNMPNFASECDRYHTSYRAAASIVTGAFKDFDVRDADGKLVRIDKCKVWREVDKNCTRLLRLQTLTDANPKAFAFDGRKDKTLGELQTSDGVTHRQMIRETHITVLREPNSIFLGYAVAESGNAPDTLEALYAFFEEKQMSLVNLIGVCCDGEAKNTGKDAGILRLLEVRLQKPLHWFVCMLHSNELPFRHIFEKIDSSFTAIKDVNKPVRTTVYLYYFMFIFDKKKIFIRLLQVVNFCPIPALVEENLPADIANFVMSDDERYLYRMAVAVSSGVCSMELANLLPGPIHHARWLTKACRALRSYVSTEKPSKNLIDLVTFILRVYVPTYFNVKHRNSCIYGSIHFYNLVQWSRYLPPLANLALASSKKYVLITHTSHTVRIFCWH